MLYSSFTDSYGTAKLQSDIWQRFVFNSIGIMVESSSQWQFYWHFLEFVCYLAHLLRILSNSYPIWMRIQQVLHNGERNFMMQLNFTTSQMSDFQIKLIHISSILISFISIIRFINRLTVQYQFLLLAFFSTSITGICSALLSLNAVLFHIFSIFFSLIDDSIKNFELSRRSIEVVWVKLFVF